MTGPGEPPGLDELRDKIGPALSAALRNSVEQGVHIGVTFAVDSLGTIADSHTDPTIVAAIREAADAVQTAASILLASQQLPPAGHASVDRHN